VGLGEARYRKVDTYSLGMKQLAKLAQAIVHGPKQSSSMSRPMGSTRRRARA